MFIALTKANLVQRFCSWLFGARIESKPSPPAASRADAPFMVPMLFVARTAEAPDEPTNLINLFPARCSQEWSFAARLKSVATDNVPKVRKGHRAKTTPPAGKAVPRKAAPLLKSYKPSTGVPATAPWKKSAARHTSHTANVIVLAKTSQRFSERSLAVVERIAA